VAFGIAAVAIFSACSPEFNAEMTVYEQVNALRAESGLAPLAPDVALVEIARARSRDMAANGYFGHNPPNGCDYVCLMGRNGVSYAYAGEVIAWNTAGWSQAAGLAVRTWGNSPPHRDKLLDCHYTRAGAGVAEAPDGRIYVTVVLEGNVAC
jgi:uncharacterized protein YkwD